MKNGRGIVVGVLHSEFRPRHPFMVSEMWECTSSLPIKINERAMRTP